MVTTRGVGGGGGGKFLQIKQEDKFFSRLLSKETSKEASFRVLYYGGAAGAIPFMWESRPGTPKHTLSDTSLLPPLTPPPSYQINPSIIINSPHTHTHTHTHNNNNKPLLPSISLSMPKFLQFLRMSRGKEKQKSSSFSSSSFSSSYSMPSSSTSSCTNGRNKKSTGVPRSNSESGHPVHLGFVGVGGGGDEEQRKRQAAISSPTSTLCFRRAKFGMKRRMLSFVGHAR